MKNAAVLSIAIKAAGVMDTQRELGGLDRKARDVSDSMDKSGKRGGRAFAMVGKAAGLAAAGGIAGAALAVKGFVSAAMESEKSQARMETQLKALGISYGKHAGTIDTVIQKHSRLSGLDDEDLQDAFTNIVRTTGDVSKGLELTGLAADFARAKHMDVAKAGEIVAKVAGGNTGILGRYGVQIEKGASATEALGALQAKFAGQAKAYGDTTAGAQDRFRVAVENLQEKLGKFLLPIVEKVSNALASFVTGLETGTGTGGRFRDAMVTAFGAVRDAVGTAISSVQDWLERNRDTLKDVGKISETAFRDVLVPAFEFVKAVAGRVLPAVEQMVRGFGDVIKGVVEVISGILTGDFGKAWDGVKSIFSGAIGVIVGGLRAATAPFREAVSVVMGAVIDGIRGFLQPFVDAGKWIVNRVKDGVLAAANFAADVGGWIKNRVVDGIELYIEGFKTVGGWIVNRVADGLKAVAGFASDIGGWIKNRVVDGVQAFGDAVEAVGGFITRRIVAGVKGIAGLAEDIGGWLKDRVEGAWTLVKTSAEWLGSRIGNAIGAALRGALSTAMDGIKGILNVAIDAMNVVISGLNKVPKVDIPKIQKLASGTRNFRGGLALVGERGPELVSLPRGADVFSHQQSMRMVGAGGPQVSVNIAAGMEWLLQFIDVRIDGKSQAAEAAYLAGARP